MKYNTHCALFQPQAGFQCSEMPRSFTEWPALIVLLVHCHVYLLLGWLNLPKKNLGYTNRKIDEI